MYLIPRRLATVSTLLRSLVDRIEREELKEERRLAKERAAEERRRVAAAQRAAATLTRHKEALKREILKKRAALEKELDQQAHVRTFAWLSLFQHWISAQNLTFGPILISQDEVTLELREYLSRSAVVALDCTASNLPTSPLKIDPESPPFPDQVYNSPVKYAPASYASPNHGIPNSYTTPSHATPARSSHVNPARSSHVNPARSSHTTPTNISPTAAGAKPMVKKSPPTSAK